MYQQNPQKLKNKENKQAKKENRISKGYGKTTTGITCLMGTPIGEERKKQNKYIK